MKVRVTWNETIEKTATVDVPDLSLFEDDPDSVLDSILDDCTDSEEEEYAVLDRSVIQFLVAP